MGHLPQMDALLQLFYLYFFLAVLPCHRPHLPLKFRPPESHNPSYVPGTVLESWLLTHLCFSSKLNSGENAIRTTYIFALLFWFIWRALTFRYIVVCNRFVILLFGACVIVYILCLFCNFSSHLLWLYAVYYFAAEKNLPLFFFNFCTMLTL